MDRLAQIAERPIVFAARTLASYERKRLVLQKVPFVVPGNQLYLPDLGIDFREYFRQPAKAVTAFSPATQALLIAALLRKDWQAEWQPAEAIAELGYTAMTLSRAARELTAADLAESQPDSSRWQIWSYAPNLLTQDNVVDPLSLTLSLQDDPDDRVQQALADLRGKFPW